MRKEKAHYTLVIGDKVEEGETEIIIETREELKKRKEKGE
jgi:hypothetical protein